MFGADATAVGAFWDEQGDDQQDHLDYLFPRFTHQQPWSRDKAGSSIVTDDFILIAEFSEQEGPRPVIVIPKDGGTHFDQNEFSVKILAVDHQSSIAENTQLSEDTQVVMTDAEKQVHAFVHHLVLNDIHARGYVRPFCITYVTSDPRKIMTCYEELSTQMKKVARLMKYGNRLVFMRDLEKHLEDLSYTKAHLLLSQSRNMEAGSGRNSATAENELLNVLNNIRQSMEEVTGIMADLKPCLDDKELQEKFENFERHLKSDRRFSNYDNDSGSLKDFVVDKSQKEELSSSGSYTESTLSEFSLFGKSKDLKPKLLDVHAMRGKRRFDRSLRGLHELCSWGAKEGLQRLRVVREFFRRDLSCLQIDELEATVVYPSCGVLTFGPDLIGANFLSSHLRTSDQCCSRRQFYYTNDSIHSWTSTDSTDSFKSLNSSFHSAIDDEDSMVSARSSFVDSVSTLDRVSLAQFETPQDIDTPTARLLQERRYSDIPSSKQLQDRRLSDQTGKASPKSVHNHNQSKHLPKGILHTCGRCSAKENDDHCRESPEDMCMCKFGSSADTVVESELTHTVDKERGQTLRKARGHNDTVTTVNMTEYEEYLNIEIDNDETDDDVHVKNCMYHSEDKSDRDTPVAGKGCDSPVIHIQGENTCFSEKDSRNVNLESNTSQKNLHSQGGCKDSASLSQMQSVQNEKRDVLTESKSTKDSSKNESKESAVQNLWTHSVNAHDHKVQICDENTTSKRTANALNECDNLGSSTVNSSDEHKLENQSARSEPVKNSNSQSSSSNEQNDDPLAPDKSQKDSLDIGHESRNVENKPQNGSEKPMNSPIEDLSPPNSGSSMESGISSKLGKASQTGSTKGSQTDSSCEQKHKTKAWTMRHKRKLKIKTIFKENADSDYGLQKILTSYNNMQHVIYSLLSGRPVIVMGTKRHETQIRELINALRVFLPVLSSDHVTLLCQLRQMRLVDVHQFRLAGIIRPEKKSLDYIVPPSIRRYLTLFDVERQVFHCQPYQGSLLGFISAIYSRKKLFKSEQALYAFIQTHLMEISMQAFNFYHCICMADKESSFSGASVLRKSSMLEMSAEKFLNKKGLQNSDCRIVKVLAEIIKVQQIEQEFKSKCLTDSPVYPFSVVYQTTQTFRCGQGR